MKEKLSQSIKKILGTDTGARLSRLPFLIIHVLAYAVVYFMFQVILYSTISTPSVIAAQKFIFTFLMFVLSIVLLPVHVRRAHDISWSIKMPLYFSVLPSVLRVLFLMVPMIIIFSPSMLPVLLKIMPYIGFGYWLLSQIQIIFTVVLIFAPGTSTHNRFTGELGTAFNLKNLYGFSVLKGKEKLANNTSDR